MGRKRFATPEDVLRAKNKRQISKEEALAALSRMARFDARMPNRAEWNERVGKALEIADAMED